MGVEYVSVQWNRQKKIYDLVLVGGVAAYLVLFAVLTKVLFPYVTDEIMLMRAFGYQVALVFQSKDDKINIQKNLYCLLF